MPLWQSQTKTSVNVSSKETPDPLQWENQVKTTNEVSIQTTDGAIDIKFSLDKKTTVANVKRKIEERDGILSSNQTLVLGNRILSDEDILSQKTLQDHRVVYLTVKRLPVTVIKSKDGNQSARIDIGYGDSVKQVKETLQDEKTWNIADGMFIYQGRQAQENDTLFYNMQRDPAPQIFIVLPTIQVFVRGLDGKTKTVTISKSDTILQLKKAVEDKTGVEAGVQRLIFSGKQLEDHKLVSDYNIEKESTLHLVLRLKGGRL